jgi:hypothetical protein
VTKLYCNRAEDADYHVVSASFHPTGDELICPDHGGQMSTFKPRSSTLSSSSGPPKKRKPLKRGKGFAASKEQREKIKGLPCVGCGADPDDWYWIDPAHLWPRGKGGCDDPLCVVPLCRGSLQNCHQRFDEGKLDLLPKLIDRGYFKEMAHAIEAHELSPLTLLERVTGETWMPAESPSREGVAR